ncbi:hypothetical protein PPSIR1_29108 [Plesiocystis pacifica SIR-1]|uniref:Lipoprotein n=1 Tax=Plesiocystis pacifica SIR-1 TaxID=391625 RepID=A6GHV3_9BACT|nr:hypothetical protein [Plesiocystis pacifica]EDM74550.1 hypothetical protein PPSIR1_29108 [Plesiocystis pacifica SIR-1]
MKATFICSKRAFLGLGWLFASTIAIAGCVDLELPPEAEDEAGEDGDSEGDESGCEGDCEPTHDLSGELVLFVNARLSDADSAFQSHLPLEGEAEGSFLGNALYLYDPTRECEDGTNACRLATVGNLHLDASLGQISVDDGSLRKFVIQDLANDPDQGLWGAGFDPLNDEWSILRLGVEDWNRRDNAIDVERWVIPPGAAESPSTDPCYWFESVSGLGFVGGELVLGVRGIGSKGLVSDGSLFHVDIGVLEQGHCVQPSDVSQDPLYYACDVLCEQRCSFGSKVGVAGDLVESLDGGQASAWLRSEDDGIMPLDRNELASCSVAEGVSEAEPDNVFLLDVVRGDEIDGLARVNGQLYGLSVLGSVYLIDEVERTVELVDDLSTAFPEQGLRLRGATSVTVPAAD